VSRWASMIASATGRGTTATRMVVDDGHLGSCQLQRFRLAACQPALATRIGAPLLQSGIAGTSSGKAENILAVTAVRTGAPTPAQAGSEMTRAHKIVVIVDTLSPVKRRSGVEQREIANAPEFAFEREPMLSPVIAPSVPVRRQQTATPRSLSGATCASCSATSGSRDRSRQSDVAALSDGAVPGRGPRTLFARKGGRCARSAARAITLLCARRAPVGGRRRQACPSQSRITMSSPCCSILSRSACSIRCGRYPVIREFAAMLKALKPGEQEWMCREFFGYTSQGPTAFNPKTSVDLRRGKASSCPSVWLPLSRANPTIPNELFDDALPRS